VDIDENGVVRLKRRPVEERGMLPEEAAECVERIKELKEENKWLHHTLAKTQEVERAAVALVERLLMEKIGWWMGAKAVEAYLMNYSRFPLPLGGYGNDGDGNEFPV